MAVYRCEYCGSALTPQDPVCTGCGAPNPHFDADYTGPRPQTAAEPAPFTGKPRTIAELQAFCRTKNMPLEKMRFFIGRDEPSPRAFGIFRHGRDITVYKNKADGTRVIRYLGQDEAFAVNEIYQKLLEEHRKRSGSARPGGTGSRSYGGSARAAAPKSSLLKYLPLILILLGYLVFSYLPGRLGHRQDGYYRVGDDLFYRYGSSWFLDSYGDSGDWYQVDSFPYEDYDSYYQGSDYDSSWGGSDFTESYAWDELQDSGSDWDSDWDSSDYDSWDSGDTDWDSDW